MPLTNSALPALDIGPAFDPYKALSEQQDFETNSALAPYKLQDQENVYNLRKADYGNNMLTEAATQALAADPDQAPGIWDTQMQKLAAEGVPGASQFIGRYRPDVAARLQSAFSGGGKDSVQSVSQANAPNPQSLQQAIAQIPQDKLEKSVGSLNMAISSFNKVTNQDEWNQELQTLKNAGIPVNSFINPSADWREQYAQAYRAVQNMLPYRDAMQQRLTQQSVGLNIQPQQTLTARKPGDVLTDQTGKIITTIPGEQAKEPWEFVDATKTGGIPLTHNKATDEWRDPATNKVVTPPASAVAAAKDGAGMPVAGPDSQSVQATHQAYSALTDAVMKSENASGNPAAQSATSTASGPGQVINATWVQSVRNALPGAKAMTDQQIIDMKTDPRFQGFARDMTSQILQQGGADLQKAGLPVTTSTAAIAYKLGSPAAIKVLNARDPNTPMSSILSPQAIKANPQWAKMSVSDFDKSMLNQFGNAPISAGASQQTQQPGEKSPFGSGPTGMGDVPPPDAESTSIMANAGISYPAFQLLTNGPQGTGRWDKTLRAQAMKEVQDWTAKTGVDLSTFPAEYKANNGVLQSNIQRNAQAKIMENEVLRTIQNLRPVADDSTVGNLNRANALAILAGKETNGPVSQQYRFYLTQLRRELTGYFSTLEPKGGSSSEITDNARNESNDLIANGIDSGGLNGLQTAVINSQHKMRDVLQNSIDDARQSVWDQFGVGQNYKRRTPALTETGGGARQLSAQDQQAAAWANANPNDPRSAQIKQRLGM